MALFLLLVLVFTPRIVSAQEATGKIIGTITDPLGAVVPAVEVTVINVETHLTTTTTTDKDGVYQVLHLPIGHYKVTARRNGFVTVSTASYGLEINQSLRIDIKLAVGGATETVEVTGNASMVEAYNSTISASVTE